MYVVFWPNILLYHSNTPRDGSYQNFSETGCLKPVYAANAHACGDTCMAVRFRMHFFSQYPLPGSVVMVCDVNVIRVKFEVCRLAKKFITFIQIWWRYVEYWGHVS